MCERVNFGDGGFAIICGLRRRRASPCEICRERSHSKLCDGYVGGGKTCDAKLCDRCARHVGPDRDLCPRHATREKLLEELRAMTFPAKRIVLERNGYKFQYSRPCKRCSALIEFWRTPKNNLAPFEVVVVEGEFLLESHFATCPFAKEFREKSVAGPTQAELFQ